MSMKSTATRAAIGALFSLWVTGCGSEAHEGHEHGAQLHAPASSDVGFIPQATSCAASVKRYPVNGRHNNGYDSGWSNFQCSPTTGSLSNSDFIGGQHLGNDIFGAKGTPIVAAQDGYIRIGFTDSIGGNVVYVQDNCGWWYYYAHLQTVSRELYVGKWVSAGTYLGTLGDTGSAAGTAPHLHFSIYPDGSYNSGIDPHALIKNVEGTTACSTSRVGYNSSGSYSSAIAGCHSRNGGAYLAGTPFDNGGTSHVHAWGSGVVQDNNGGTYGPNSCMQKNGVATSYMVRGGIWSSYVYQLGGAEGWLGYPTSDEFTSNGAPRQNFESGYITWNGSGFAGYRY
ncbi:MAG TPA: peptidoglycan DD-metalloendopeptidase family protein [Archangium sp.]|nr:peptidoglycan DD-metalloendopeptidase family protein [Archangium sp.]